MLLNNDILAHVVNRTLSGNADIMMDYCDGANFKYNALFQNQPSAIQLHLYTDDFKIVNPIGTYTVTPKGNAMYMFIYFNVLLSHYFLFH